MSASTLFGGNSDSSLDICVSNVRKRAVCHSGCGVAGITNSPCAARVSKDMERGMFVSVIGNFAWVSR